MPPQIFLSRWPRRGLPWIGVGIALRLFFFWFPRPIDDDTWDYLQLGHNLLHHRIYGVGSGANISPSLFRLPAYPIFLATCEQIFARFWPGLWLNSVYLVQAIADVAGALLLASFARRHLSQRAGEVALILAMLCPFTIAYVGIGMTECLSVFCVSLGIYSVSRAVSAESAGNRDPWPLLLAGCASALAMLLRPDGAILFAVLAAGLFFYTLRVHAMTQSRRQALRGGFAVTFVYCSVALLPLSLWTLRNWTEFHVFQPLAPRYLDDPGDRPNVGFYRWLRTWSVEYVTTANVFWCIGEGPIDLAALPSRAFDSPQQRAQTLELIAGYNRYYSISAALDNRFAALAAERIRTHPFRYYVTLPLLRVADMLLRPRTEAFYLDAFWWRWSEHPGQSACAILLGLINLIYVAAAAWAFLRRRVPWATMLAAYLVLRFLMLATIENPEPRYTLECFPIFIVAAAAALSHFGGPAASAPYHGKRRPALLTVRQSSSD